MRVLFVISALSIATFVCALPADHADDFRTTFTDEQPMSLLQDAQRTVSDMKAKGATEADCADLATTMCKEVEDAQSGNQKLLNDLQKGNQCLNLGQEGVTLAESQLKTKTDELEAAETAESTANGAEVQFNNARFDSVTRGECGNLFTSGSTYEERKQAHDAAVQKKAVAKGAKEAAQTALHQAETSAATLKKNCLCETRKTREQEWARLTHPALKAEQEKAKAKCRMMTCVLEGTSTSDDSCKSDLTPLTKPDLIDQAEHVAGCSTTTTTHHSSSFSTSSSTTHHTSSFSTSTTTHHTGGGSGGGASAHCEEHYGQVWAYCGGSPPRRFKEWGVGPEGRHAALANCAYSYSQGDNKSACQQWLARSH